MRFLFFDRVIELEKGRFIRGVKSFSLSEEFLRNHFGKIALVPGAIMIEAMAQLLGWLIVYSSDFRASALMSLVEDVTVTPRLRPGFRAEIYGEIVSISKTDSLGSARMTVDGQAIASINRIIYSHLHRVDADELRRLFWYYSGLHAERLPW
jgi:3-hydroxyacyl-[acyl-carrier-protein] dehydratase